MSLPMRFVIFLSVPSFFFAPFLGKVGYLSKFRMKLQNHILSGHLMPCVLDFSFPMCLKSVTAQVSSLTHSYKEWPYADRYAFNI